MLPTVNDDIPRWRRCPSKYVLVRTPVSFPLVHLRRFVLAERPCYLQVIGKAGRNSPIEQLRIVEPELPGQFLQMVPRSVGDSCSEGLQPIGGPAPGKANPEPLRDAFQLALQ